MNSMIRMRTCFLALLLAAASSLPLFSAEPDPRDWTYWRGPEWNGVSRETGLPDDWDPEGENLLWKRDDCGSRSTPIVMDGRMYFLARAEPHTPREGERVVCLNAETGETIWENRFNVWLSDVPDTRVGWSSVVGDPETGNVYALGVSGFFQCLDGKTGKPVWNKVLHEEFGLLSTYGGRTNFPVICDNLVIVSAVMINWGENAKPAHRFIAFDKKTGDVVWMNGTRLLPDDTTYSAPTVTVLNGEKALVFGSGDGSIWALQPRTGKHIWNYAISIRGVNTAPVVVGDTVFAGHSEENITGTKMGALAAINGALRGDITKSGEIWKVEEMMVGKSSPFYHDGRLYCFDDSAKGFVIDTKTGEMVGRKKITLGTIMRSSALFADGKIYIGEQNGRWAILTPDEKDGMKIVARGRLPQGEEFHASPIAWKGKVYFMSTGALYCLADKSKKSGFTGIPPQPQEKSAQEDQKPAHIQVVPAEVLIRPGEKVNYKVNVFNAAGQFLKQSEADFQLAGPGKVSPSGEFEVPADTKHEATIVTARVGDLTGKARVRIVPPLPWEFDFEGLTDAPVTWIGARYRHVMRKVDGNTVMVKVSTIPKGTRSRSWFGQADLHDYTIQADVRGSIVNEKMPDIGLIAQGYTFFMLGEDQSLQIQAWEPQLRVNKVMEFKWDPAKWYTMKFQVDTTSGKAQLRGKVWPRGEEEPKEWTVETEDEMPNKMGSPGLFGNATNAEIFLDNIKVVPNAL